MPPSEWTIDETRGPDSLRAVEADWRRLYAQMPEKTFYHSFEWNQAKLSRLSLEPDEFRCVTFSDSGVVRAIVRLMGGRAHSTYRDDALLLDKLAYGTTIVCPDDEVCCQVIPALLEYLRRTPSSSSLVAIGPLPRTSPVWSGLHEMRASAYFEHSEEGKDVFDCTKLFDELMSELSKGLRAKLRAAARRLEALRDVRYVTARTVPEILSEYESFLAVEASGWKGASRDGVPIALSPWQVALYRDLAEGLGGLGQCEINAIYAEGHCISAQLCTITGNSYTVLRTAYDERYDRVIPGLLNLQRTLERCCADPAIERLDMISDTPWVRRWHPDVIPMSQAHVVIRPVSGRVLLEVARFRYGYGRRFVRWLRSKQRRPTRKQVTAGRHADAGQAVLEVEKASEE